MLVINKSILKTFFCSNHCFQVKYESSVYNTGFSSAQVVFYLNHERTNQAQFTTTNSSKEMCRRVLMCEDNRGWTFSLEEALLSKRNLYFGQKKWFKGIVHPKIEMTPWFTIIVVARGAWFSEVCSGRKTQETAVSKWVKCKMRNTCVWLQ